MQNLNYNTIGVRNITKIAMSEQDKRKWAEKRFFEDIERSKKSAEEFGWISEEEADEIFANL